MRRAGLTQVDSHPRTASADVIAAYNSTDRRGLERLLDGIIVMAQRADAPLR